MKNALDRSYRDRQLSFHQAKEKNIIWKVKRGFLKFGISMFVIQLPSHPWEGGQQMPAKWLGSIYVSGEFYKRAK